MVKPKQSLPQVSDAKLGLGQATIMERDLAAQHGVQYVHLAAFAIDVDRAYIASDGDDGLSPLPLGWEVLLLLAYVLARFRVDSEHDQLILEDVASRLVSGNHSEPCLGACLAFALHEGTDRGWLDANLKPIFRRWGSRSKQLKKSLDAQLQDPSRALIKAAKHCLETGITPPLSPPTLSSLQDMVSGEFPISFPIELDSKPR